MVKKEILVYQAQNKSGDITAEQLIEVLDKYFEGVPKTAEELQEKLEDPDYSLKAKNEYGKDIELKVSELYDEKIEDDYQLASYVSMDIKKRFYYEEQEEYNVDDFVALDITCTNITDKELTDLSYKFVVTRPDGTQITQEEGIHTIEQLNGEESNTVTHGYQFNHADMGGVIEINTILSYKVKSTGEVKTEEQSCEFNTAEKKEPVGFIRVNATLKDIDTEDILIAPNFRFLVGAFEDEDRCILDSGVNELNIKDSSSGTIEIPIYEYGSYYIGAIDWGESGGFELPEFNWCLAMIGRIGDSIYEFVYPDAEGDFVEISKDNPEKDINIDVMFYEIPEGY